MNGIIKVNNKIDIIFELLDQNIKFILFVRNKIININSIRFLCLMPLIHNL